jgi:hypothetical protein
MGGIGDFLFGSPSKEKSSSESSSGNYAWDSINSAFKPALGYVTQSGNAISSLLGLGGDAAGQRTALDQFANSTGMDFIKDQGMDMITSNQAAKGLLNSGDTLKASQQYGQQLGSTYMNQYMQNLFGLGGMGLQAGGVMADAGRWSKSKSEGKATGAKDGALGSIIQGLSMIPGISDIRLKRNIKHVRTASDGLNVYSYDLYDGTHVDEGVMAHEVAHFRPEAYLEGYFNGYHGVNYARLGSLE